MKILWFTNTPCGATEIITGNKVTGGGWLFTLAEQLKQQPGVELHIAFYYKDIINGFVHDGIHYHPIYREVYKNKLQMIVGQFKSRFINNYDTRSLDKVENVIKIIAPDIIHIHGSEENFGLVAKKISNINVVLSIQGLIAPYKEKLFAGIPEEKIYKYEPFICKILYIGSKSISKKMSQNAQREKEIFRSIDHVIGRTKWDFDCSLSYNPNRKYYIVNEILRSEFMQHHWINSKPDIFTLVTTVSNGLYKGVESIYKTAKILKDAGFNIRWNVIGLNQYDRIVHISESYIGEEASALGIKLLGRMNATQMIQVLDSSDLFIQVSHIENSPNSLCEAMAIGMPIISTFAGGTSSMLVDGVEGVLVQDGDSFSMAGAIIHASINYQNMLSMAEKARTHALKRHDPNSVCLELMYVYNKLYSQNNY